MVDPLDNLTSSEQLRRLLLQEEQERIEQLESRVGDDQALKSSLGPIISDVLRDADVDLLQEEQEKLAELDARLGDDDSLKNSLIPIIADILRDAGVKDYKRLAGALAPVILQSIKTEIHNSRDMMVDALYPITGRLVAAAVRNAFKDLVDQLNKRLDSTLSVDRWRAKLKAMVSGRSEAEILLSEGAAFEIADMLLIDRLSGLLIAQSGPDADDGGVDSQLLGSILTAIMAFVRDAMGDASEQDLRTLHVGDLRLHLQVSPGAILAIKTKGPPPAGFETSLNETFCAFLARWGDTLSRSDDLESHDKMALTEDLEERFQSLLNAKQRNFKKPSKKGAVLLGGLALAAILWVGWTAYKSWSGSQIEAVAKSVIEEQGELMGFPIETRYRHDDNTLTVSGLLPSQDALTALSDGLEAALPDVTTAMLVGKLPDPDPVLNPNEIPTKDDLAASQQALRQDMQDDLAASQRAMREDMHSEISEDLGSVVEQFDQRLSSLSGAIESVEARWPELTEAKQASLRLWFAQQAIRFGEDAEFEDEARANDVMQGLVARLRDMPPYIGLRVIGYGDDLGEDRVSARVSRTRALAVADRLSELGVSPERLQAVGRGRERRLSEVDGPGSLNRRVEFELIDLLGGLSETGSSSGTDDGAR